MGMLAFDISRWWLDQRRTRLLLHGDRWAAVHEAQVVAPWPRTHLSAQVIYAQCYLVQEHAGTRANSMGKITTENSGTSDLLTLRPGWHHSVAHRQRAVDCPRHPNPTWLCTKRAWKQRWGREESPTDYYLGLKSTTTDPTSQRLDEVRRGIRLCLVAKKSTHTSHVILRSSHPPHGGETSTNREKSLRHRFFFLPLPTSKRSLSLSPPRLARLQWHPRGLISWVVTTMCTYTLDTRSNNR
jgi:hypothetical protein